MRRALSPNFGARRNGARPDHVVIHYTAMKTAEAAIRWLCAPASQVSAHYVICKTGAITQLVPEGARAWHAGLGSWHSETDMNSRSVGIELDNMGTGPFSEPQMRALLWLLGAVTARWAIPAQNVIGHSDLAPGRKIDPGPHFDWSRLADAGLAAPVRLRPFHKDASPDRFTQLARQAGYTAEVSFEALLESVRLRHRPGAQGALSQEDMAALAGVAELSGARA